MSLTTMGRTCSAGPPVRRRTSFAALVAPVVCLLLTVQCHSDGSTGPGAVARVTVTPDSAILRSVSDTVRFRATARTAAGDTVPDVAFTWSSSDVSVARVDATGLVTAVGVGTARVTASAGGVSAGASVTVTSASGPGAVARVTVVPDSVNLGGVGDTARLRATAFSTEGDTLRDATVTWASSAVGVARVDSAGLVTAVGVGAATVTASAGGVSAGASVTVTSASVTLRPAGLALSGVGGTATLTAQYRDARGVLVSGKTFTWRSLNPNVATVDAAGGVHGVAAGQVVIAATADGATGYALATVSVREAPLANYWVPMAGSPPGMGVWGTSASSVYVAGPTGLWRWDGASWTNLASGSFGDVWGTSSTDVFAVGTGGAIVHYDGSAATPMVSGSTQGLYAVWGSSPRDVYAGSCPRDTLYSDPPCSGVLLHYDGASWRPVETGGGRVGAIWGSSAEDVHVAQGAGVRHWDGTRWTARAVSGSIQPKGLWGSSPNDVFLSAEDVSGWYGIYGGGGVWHWNGSAWTGVWSGGRVPRGIWGASSSGVYVGCSMSARMAPSQGCVLQWGGAAWQALDIGPPSFQDVWGTTPTEVFAVGPAVYRGFVANAALAPATVRFTSTGQSARIVATLADHRGQVVDGVTWRWSSSDVAVATVDSAGLVTARGSGAVTIAAETWSGNPTNVLRATATVTVAGAALSVTPDGFALTGVGASLALAAELRDATGATVPGAVVAWSSLNPAVATVDAAGVVRAVGPGQATIAATAGGMTAYALATVSVPGAAAATRLTAVASGTAQSLTGVWGTSATQAFVVGAGGTILRWDGTALTGVASGATGNLSSVWGVSPVSAFAVGGAGTVQRWDGVAWAPTASGTATMFSAVWGASPTAVFAVGYPSGTLLEGAIRRWDGVAWTPMTSTSGWFAVHDIWGTSATDAFAVGEYGTIHHWNGGAWTAVHSGTSNRLLHVWGTSSTNAYAVGEAGTILHWDGAAWTPMASGTTATLSAVWGTSADNVLAVGGNGTIVRWDGTAWTPLASGVTAGLSGIWGSAADHVLIVGSGGTVLLGGR